MPTLLSIPKDSPRALKYGIKFDPVTIDNITNNSKSVEVNLTAEITHDAQGHWPYQKESGDDSIRAGANRIVISLEGISTKSSCRHLERTRVVVTRVAPISSPKRSCVNRNGSWKESLQRKPRRLTNWGWMPLMSGRFSCYECAIWVRQNNVYMPCWPC